MQLPVIVMVADIDKKSVLLVWGTLVESKDDQAEIEDEVERWM